MITQSYPNKKWDFLPFLVLIFLASSLLSCHKDKELKPQIIPEDSCDVAVIVYIAAENSLGKPNYWFDYKSFADLDLEEMINASGDIPLSSRLIVYYDSPSQPQLLEINRQQGKVVLENRIEENSADPTTFEKVLKYVTTKYPSRHKELVMWSHASGWIPGPKRSFGIDNLTNSYVDNGSEMEISDMRRVFEHLNLHFDYIMFDACFMQCIETAYELRNHADYIIASPAEIPGDGAPYDLIMPLLMSPSEKSCKDIVDTYFSNYEDNDGAILSVIKTSELESLLKLTRELCPDFYTVSLTLNAYSTNSSNRKTYSIQPYCGFDERAHWKPEYFDMGSVMNRLLSQSDYTLWTEQLNRTVINSRFTDSWMSIYRAFFNPYIIDPDHVALVSIFIPYEKYNLNTTYNEDIKQTLWYRDFVLQAQH